jgi:hypothetical protein
VIIRKPKDGNLEMCPEATVAGLYLTTLATTGTGDVFKKLNASLQRRKE